MIFVIGGITRSEMRVAHTLSKRLAREITLGSTSLDDPASFMHNLYVSAFSPMPIRFCPCTSALFMHSLNISDPYTLPLSPASYL